MGMIVSFQKGSIRNAWDMRRALEMVLDDVFDDVGSPGFGGPDSIDFSIEDGDIDLDFQIKVIDKEKEYEERMAAKEEAKRTGDEEFILKTVATLGLTRQDAVRRLMVRPDPEPEPASANGQPAKSSSRKPARSRKR
jgi:hypothetical protein